MEIESNQFLKIIRLVALMQDFHQVVQDQESKLELLPFRIGKLLPEKAEETYRRIQKKYEFPNGLVIQPQVWLESQKRLFAWFIVFYVYINRDQTGNFPIINFSQLAPFLFHKSPDFLQFHFLTLVKNSEKTSWNQQNEGLLLSGMNEQGMKWNEVSRRVFIKTGKTVFLHPKSCRERWLNHLDGTKLKGSWLIEEDLAIFSHVVETQSKKWSKMVSLLGNKRSQHSIKNRFNTIIAKHRLYKSEKQLKVAARVLINLQKKIDLLAQANAKNNEQSQQRRILIQFDFEQQKEMQSEEQNCEKIKSPKHSHLAEIRVSKPLVLENCNDVQKYDEIMVKQEAAQQNIIPENAGSEVRDTRIDGFYPFENYSYEQDMCHYASHIFDFHQTQLFVYQQIFTIPIQTAETITRDSKILEQRRRQKQANNPHN